MPKKHVFGLPACQGKTFPTDNQGIVATTFSGKIKITSVSFATWPKALRELGHEVIVVLPKYRLIEDDKFGIKLKQKTMGVWMGDNQEWCAVHNTITPEGGTREGGVAAGSVFEMAQGPNWPARRGPRSSPTLGFLVKDAIE